MTKYVSVNTWSSGSPTNLFNFNGDKSTVRAIVVLGTQIVFIFYYIYDRKSHY